MTWPLELIAMRHGESVANAAFLAAMADGTLDFELSGADWEVPLSPLGQHQSTQAGDQLARTGEPIDVVFTSTYVRARETTSFVLAALARVSNQAPTVILDERLRDRELGVLEMCSPGQIMREQPDEVRRRERVGEFYYRPTAGESFADVIARVRAFVGDLRDSSNGQQVLVVAHHAVVLALRYVIEGLTTEDLAATEDVRNASLTRWLNVDNRLVLRSFNDTSHL